MIPVYRAVARRGSWRAEALGAVAVYGIYEIGRGLFAGDAPGAIRHARDIAAVERSVHLFVERDLQRWAHSIGGVLGLFGALYLTLHLTVTGGYLLWLYRHRPNAYAMMRATLLVATLISLVIFALYPTAPPRVAVVGVSDTISGVHFNLNHGLVSSLYNPFAAMPSMHFGYALIVGASLARQAGRLLTPLVGLLYPALVLLIILTTGNHFLFDAIAGAVVVGVAALIARPLTQAKGATPSLNGSARTPAHCWSRARRPPPLYEPRDRSAGLLPGGTRYVSTACWKGVRHHGHRREHRPRGRPRVRPRGRVRRGVRPERRRGGGHR